MKKIIMLILSIVAFNASANNLENYDACFILYNLNEQKVVNEYNPNNRCNERISPHSTFKIPLSLMAFNEQMMNQNTVFKWDGEKRELSDWNQDQTPHTFLKYSAIWVSRKITAQLGGSRIKQYLADFKYGNQDFSGELGKNNALTHAWLSGGSLKISAIEQLNFLKNLFDNRLSISQESAVNTRKNMYQGNLDNGAEYYGKTGSGRDSSTQLRDGWFVGFVEHRAQHYVFVSNLTDKNIPASTDKAYGSQVLKPIVIKLLNDSFS